MELFSDRRSRATHYGVARKLCAIPVILVCVILSSRESAAAIVGMIETFSGNGDYETTDGQFQGLDNPGWKIDGDGEITDDGYQFVNAGLPQSSDIIAEDILVIPLVGIGSFRERIIVRDLELGDTPTGGSNFDTSGILRLSHRLAQRTYLSLYLIEDAGTEPDSWRLLATANNEVVTQDVLRGQNISYELLYDRENHSATMSYDNDINDTVAPIKLNPLAVDTAYSGDYHVAEIAASAFSDGQANGTLAIYELTPFPDIVGDFNGNDVLDAADIDLLTLKVQSGDNDSLFDLTNDGLVNELDRQTWVHDLKQTFFGDTDLNGEFNSADLVQVLSFGEYEDGISSNSTWLTGDWDGDGNFTSGDLVKALADGGYEAGPRVAASAVPEPTSILSLMIGLIGTTFVVRSRGKPV